jgi:hypothetical protein
MQRTPGGCVFSRCRARTEVGRKRWRRQSEIRPRRADTQVGRVRLLFRSRGQGVARHQSGPTEPEALIGHVADATFRVPAVRHP